MKKLLYVQIVLGLVIFALSSCDNDPLAEDHLAPVFYSTYSETDKTTVVIYGEMNAYGWFGNGADLSLSSDMSNTSRYLGVNEELAGGIEVTITDCSPNTTYYYRLFLSNGGMEVYSDVSSFYVEETRKVPTVTTNNVTYITKTSAYTGGEVTSDGDAEVTERGVCYSSLTSNPTVDDLVEKCGDGVGAFSCDLEYLTPGTTYYVRAYATNIMGTSYGSVKYFMTDDPTYPPTVTTRVITDVTSTGAYCGGNVTSSGGETVTERGVCWSSYTSNPTIDNVVVKCGKGVGEFSCQLDNMSPSTTYYVRAYAINSVGVSYGGTQSFTTLAEEEVWSLFGEINGGLWDRDFDMTEVSDGVWESDEVVINGGIKIRKNHNWDISYGGTFVDFGVPFAAKKDVNNIVLPTSDITCVVKFNTNDWTITISRVGSQDVTLSDYLGTYTVTYTTNLGVESYDDVIISEIEDATGGIDVFIQGLYHGYYFMPVWGRWDESSKCIILEGGYNSTSLRFKIDGVECYSIFAPIYVDSNGDGNYLDGGDCDWGEAILQRNSDGSISYKGSIPDSEGRVSNAFCMVAFNSSTDEYVGNMAICRYVSLTKSSSSTSSIRKVMPSVIQMKSTSLRIKDVIPPASMVQMP